MTPVQVIKAEGARVTGPCELRLSAAQWAAREMILGPAPKRAKIAKLDGEQTLQFKFGEIFEIATTAKLNSELFQWDESEDPKDNGGEGSSGDDS